MKNLTFYAIFTAFAILLSISSSITATSTLETSGNTYVVCGPNDSTGTPPDTSDGNPIIIPPIGH